MNSETHAERSAPAAPTPTTNASAYSAVQATPTRSDPMAAATEVALKPAGTLPPIATARPLGHISEIQSHLPGGSNIPRSNEPRSAAALPYVAVTAMAPTAVLGADAELDDSHLQFLQRTRWVAAAMLAYYLATLVFVQPFLVGALGIATGFVGYLSARAPVEVRRMRWLRWYVWLNFAMLGLNLWLLVIALIAVGTGASGSLDGEDDDAYSDDSSAAAGSMAAAYADLSAYYSSNLGLYVGVLVGANMVVHLHGLRTAKLLLAELAAVCFARPLAAV